MYRKTVIAALTVAVVAGSAILASTTADAKNGRNGAFAAGAIIGLATGAIISGATRDHRYTGTYYEPRRRYCWDEPVRRYDPYYGRRIVVGYRTVCR